MLVLLPFIAYPILAFGKAEYIGNTGGSNPNNLNNNPTQQYNPTMNQPMVVQPQITQAPMQNTIEPSLNQEPIQPITPNIDLNQTQQDSPTNPFPPTV